MKTDAERGLFISTDSFIFLTSKVEFYIYGTIIHARRNDIVSHELTATLNDLFVFKLISPECPEM